MKIIGQKDAVYETRTKVRNVIKAIQKKQSKPEHVRKYHGAKGVLQAILNEEKKTPGHWTKNTFSKFLSKFAPTKSNTLVDVDGKTQKAVEQLVLGTWVTKFVGHGADSVGLKHNNIQITKVQRIENPDVYKKYRTGIEFACETGLSEDYKKITALSGQLEIMTKQQNQAILEGSLIPDINEYFLFHGTKGEYVDHLVLQGMDPRVGGNGLFGKGLYLAESSTKADQYAGM